MELFGAPRVIRNDSFLASQPGKVHLGFETLQERRTTSIDIGTCFSLNTNKCIFLETSARTLNSSIRFLMSSAMRVWNSASNYVAIDNYRPYRLYIITQTEIQSRVAVTRNAKRTQKAIFVKTLNSIRLQGTRKPSLRSALFQSSKFYCY